MHGLGDGALSSILPLLGPKSIPDNSYGKRQANNELGSRIDVPMDTRGPNTGAVTTAFLERFAAEEQPNKFSDVPDQPLIDVAAMEVCVCAYV